MKHKRLITVSIALSLILHILLFFALYILVLKKYKPLSSNMPKHYFVDIITLKKPAKRKVVKNKEKHKIAANIQRKGLAKKYSKTEKVPVKTVKPKSNPMAIPKKGEKITLNKNKLLKKAEKKKISALKQKETSLKKQRMKKPTIKKKTQHKTPKMVRIKGDFYNPGAILSNENHKGFLSGSSKEYRYKNAKKEATVSLGTQSLKYASYMKHIKDKVQNVWTYPQEAQVNGWQGRLLMLFSIDKNGNVVRLSLIRSSGYPVLDEAALRAVRDAAPFPPLPKRFNIERLNIYATFTYKLGFYYIH